jgi:S-adenosylmethionine uptake transporter
MQSIWMVVAALLFSLMGVAVKLASTQYGTWEIVAYRGLVGLAVIGTIIAIRAKRGGTSVRDAVSTRHLAMHLRRGISGTASLSLWFFAIAGLPLATAMTINYASPLFIGAWVAYSAMRIGERIDRAMTIALVSGFVGVVLLLQPSFNRDQWIYAVIGVTSTTLTAVAYLSVKALGRIGEPETRIVFWFSALNAAAGLVGAAVFGFHGHDARGLALLATVGVTGALAQLAVTRAFSSGGTLLTANLGYTGIVFSSTWGYLVFGDRVGLTNGLGMAIIVVSGVIATLMTARALKRAKSEPDEPVSSPLKNGVPDHASAARRP